jgi:DNA polymerase-4
MVDFSPTQYVIRITIPDFQSTNHGSLIMTRHILHLDLDAFFVSVERVFNPQLHGKPVIVGGDPRGRGVVASASYEARAYGIRSAMPLAQAKKLCSHAVFIVARHARYQEFSEKVLNMLKRYAPVVEAASVDEFYLDMTGCDRLYGNIFAVATQIKADLRKKLGLPASIGLGSNKLIAKIAAALGKPEGLLWVFPGEEASILAPLPVAYIPGIGHHTQSRLQELGIRTIGELAQFPQPLLLTAFGKHGRQMNKRARGLCSSPVTEHREPKSLSREVTFNTDTIDPRTLEMALCRLAEGVGYRIRRLGMAAGTVTIKLRYSDFQTISRSQTVPPTDDDVEIFQTARALFKKAFSRRVRIRLLGVKLSNLLAKNPQGALFVPPEEIKKEQLHLSTDSIRKRFGMEALHLGRALGRVHEKRGLRIEG